MPKVAVTRPNFLSGVTALPQTNFAYTVDDIRGLEEVPDD